MDNTQHHIPRGLQAGDEINQAVADIIVDKCVLMLKNALTNDFNTILEARLTEAQPETSALPKNDQQLEHEQQLQQ